MTDAEPDRFAQRLAAINPGVAAGAEAPAVRMTPIDIEPRSREDSQERRDLRLFAGRNVDKFLSIYDAMLAGRPRFTCWPAFFFPQIWFLYRKLYGWAAASCALPVLVGAAHPNILVQRTTLIVMIVLGTAGRWLYVMSARATIARIRGAARDEEEALSGIARAGGVSMPGGVIGGLIYVGFLITAVTLFIRSRA